MVAPGPGQGFVQKASTAQAVVLLPDVPGAEGMCASGLHGAVGFGSFASDTIALRVRVENALSAAM